MRFVHFDDLVGLARYLLLKLMQSSSISHGCLYPNKLLTNSVDGETRVATEVIAHLQPLPKI
jgi:hypothetical protein